MRLAMVYYLLFIIKTNLVLLRRVILLVMGLYTYINKSGRLIWFCKIQCVFSCGFHQLEDWSVLLAQLGSTQILHFITSSYLHTLRTRKRCYVCHACWWLTPNEGNVYISFQQRSKSCQIWSFIWFLDFVVLLIS